jgi:hypothetical protein
VTADANASSEKTRTSSSEPLDNSLRFSVKALIWKLTKLTEMSPSLLDLPVYLEGCDCANEWSGDFDISDDYFRLSAELGRTPTTTMEVKVDPRVEELRKRGILPP